MIKLEFRKILGPIVVAIDGLQAADQLITCIVSVFLTTAFNLAGAESICSEDTRSMINSVIQ